MSAVVRAMLVLLPVGMLVAGAFALLVRYRTLSCYLQLFGAGCLIVVVLAHIAEALHLFPGMGWGAEHSAGHYLDLASAALGLAAFPAGYLLHAAGQRRSAPG